MTQQCSWTQPIFLRACSVMTDSAAHGLWPGRLLCPWNFQASILEWVAISSSTRSSRPGDWTHLSWVSSFGRQIVYHRATRETHVLVLQIHSSPWRQLMKIAYLTVSPPPPITPHSRIPTTFNHGSILLPLPSSTVFFALSIIDWQYFGNIILLKHAPIPGGFFSYLIMLIFIFCESSVSQGKLHWTYRSFQFPPYVSVHNLHISPNEFSRVLIFCICASMK